MTLRPWYNYRLREIVAPPGFMVPDGYWYFDWNEALGKHVIDIARSQDPAFIPFPIECGGCEDCEDLPDYCVTEA